jgi:hypothetical protein
MMPTPARPISHPMMKAGPLVLALGCQRQDDDDDPGRAQREAIPTLRLRAERPN